MGRVVKGQADSRLAIAPVGESVAVKSACKLETPLEHGHP
jgi:hypothetical protein